MATIEDLIDESFTDKSKDQAIEELRQIRLSRRIPKKASKPKTTSKSVAQQAAKHLDKKSINEILEIIGDS